MIVPDCYSLWSPSDSISSQISVSNEAVESCSHRATLQSYNYLLLSLIIAQPPPINSSYSRLFCGIQVIC